MFNKNHLIPLAGLSLLVFACRAATSLVLLPTTTPTPSPTVTSTMTPAFTATSTLEPSPTASPTITPLPPSIDEMLAKCQGAEEVAAIDADLKLTFESDPTSGRLVCTARQGSADLTRLQERTYQALITMKRLQFNRPLPWTDKTLYDWFVASVDGIRFRRDIENSFCCEPENVINVQTHNLAALSTDRWVNPESGAGLQDLVVLFVHEARHNEGYGHTCGSNDNTIAEMGAWGVQYELYRWLAFHSDPFFMRSVARSPNYYRELAREAATWTLSTRFCAEPTPTSGPPPPLP